ncbi:MAG TPA: flippase [Bacteroidota bacterium]|nr:flippase [Bacteroidota bacterium]
MNRDFTQPGGVTQSRDIAQSVARNTAVQFGQQLVTWASSFVLMLFLPRILGPERYGRIYLAEMVAAMFVVLVTYDGRFSIARRVSRNRAAAGEILVNSIGFRLGLWVFSLVGMLMFALAAGYSTPVVIILAIFGVEMVWNASRTVLSGSFLGFEVTTYTAIGAIVEKMFVSAVGITALFLGGNEIVIAAVMTAGSLINFIITAGYFRRYVPRLPRFDRAKAWILMKEGFPFLLWTIFGVVYYRIDTVMLSLMTPEKVVGWYGVAYKFYDVLVFLPSIFTIAILPVLSKLYGKENMLLARTTQKGLDFILLTGIPISILCFYFSPDIIGFLFGIENYAPAVLNLRIFAAGLLLLYLDMVLATAIIACDKQKQLAIISFVAVLLNVGMNYLMIPYTQARMDNGGVGAAIATTITELFVLVCNLLILPKSIFEGSSLKVLWKSTAGGIATILLLGAIGRIIPGIPWMVHAAAGGIFYAGTLLLMKTFRPEEIRFFREFVNLRGLIRRIVPERSGGQ